MRITPPYTQGQYVFLHDAILEGYTSGDTEIVVGKLAKRMTELEAMDDEGISGFRKEFEVSNSAVCALTTACACTQQYIQLVYQLFILFFL